MFRLASSKRYNSFSYQCLRRLFEEKDPMQGYNAMKYFLTVAAVCLRTTYSIDIGLTWKLLTWLFSICAAAFSTYWDIVIDWGLLQRNSNNPWLRDKLILPHKSVYFTAMVGTEHRNLQAEFEIILVFYALYFLHSLILP